MATTETFENVLCHRFNKGTFIKREPTAKTLYSCTRAYFTRAIKNRINAFLLCSLSLSRALFIDSLFLLSLNSCLPSFLSSFFATRWSQRERIWRTISDTLGCDLCKFISWTGAHISFWVPCARFAFKLHETIYQVAHFT